MRIKTHQPVQYWLVGPPNNQTYLGSTLIYFASKKLTDLKIDRIAAAKQHGEVALKDWSQYLLRA